MRKILGVGGAAYDMLSLVDRIPSWEEIEYVQSYDVQQGGMVATALVAASRLGANTEYIGVIGDDPQGDYMMKNFRKNGVTCDRVKVLPDESSAFTVVLIQKSTGKRAFLHNKGVNKRPDLGEGELDLRDVSHIIFDGFYFDTALRLAARARKLGIESATDISPMNRHPQLREFLSLIDYPILSELLVKPYTGISNPLAAGKSLLSGTNKALLVTCSESGVYIITNDGTKHIPAFSVEAVDTTGAGDVFHGAFAFARFEGYDLEQSVILASATSALKCTKIGGQSGIPTWIELKNFLEKKQPDAVSWLNCPAASH